MHSNNFHKKKSSSNPQMHLGNPNNDEAFQPTQENVVERR